MSGPPPIEVSERWCAGLDRHGQWIWVKEAVIEIWSDEGAEVGKEGGESSLAFHHQMKWSVRIRITARMQMSDLGRSCFNISAER